jgi:hypothetical protein
MTLFEQKGLRKQGEITSSAALLVILAGNYGFIE